MWGGREGVWKTKHQVAFWIKWRFTLMFRLILSPISFRGVPWYTGSTFPAHFKRRGSLAGRAPEAKDPGPLPPYITASAMRLADFSSRGLPSAVLGFLGLPWISAAKYRAQYRRHARWAAALAVGEAKVPVPLFSLNCSSQFCLRALLSSAIFLGPPSPRILSNSDD